MKFLNSTKNRLIVATVFVLAICLVYFNLQKTGQIALQQPTVNETFAVQNDTASQSVISVKPQIASVTLGTSARKRLFLSKNEANTLALAVPYSHSDIDTEEDEEAERKTEQDRWATEFEMIKDPKTGQIPKGIHQKSIESAQKVKELQLPVEIMGKDVSMRTLPAIDVTVRGPNNYGGRTRAIVFDKTNVQNVISGGVSSGVYRSTDGGVTWTRATPSGLVQGVTAIAQDPRAGQTNIWYFGTGESGSSASGTGGSYLGNGIWKSTDNGVTWAALQSTQGDLYSFDNSFDNISRILVDANGAILVTAGESIQRSADGGNTWTAVLGEDAFGKPCDLIYNAVGNVFYAGMNGTTTGAGTTIGVYRSTDGITWTQIISATQLNAGGVKRIVLANVAATANILALYETTTSITCTSGGTSNAGLQLYDANAMTWTNHSQKIGICAAGSSDPKVINFQNGYNMCMTTKPDDADYVYLGGTEIYRLRLSTGDYQYIGGDQGAANATNLHVDNHILVFEPGSNTKMWAGNDGGIRYTDVTGTIAAGPSGGYTWVDRSSGYITYQYYRADISPFNGSNFVAGAAQDNAITLQPSTAQAKEIHGGDGTSIGIISGVDFNTYNVVAATQLGSIVRIENGVSNNIQPYGQAQAFKTYFLLDADNTNYLYYPTNTKKLFRTRAAQTITTTDIGDVTTGWEEMTGIASTISGDISAICVTRNANLSNGAYTASNAARKMYIGTKDGKVYRLADPAFGDITAAPILITPTGASASAFVSDVAVNPYDDKEVMVTYSNYNVPSVFYTADASVASPVWVNVEGPSGSAVQLASARSAMIVQVGTVPLYMVGTSTGTYATLALSGGTTVWERVGTNDIAFSPSVSLRLRPSDNKAILGTHGNGLFMLSFPSSVLPLDLLSFRANKVQTSVQLMWTSANEVNFDHYNIQKSQDSKSFIFMKTIDATGKGIYEAIDEKPHIGQNYYRLEMVDRDGKIQYSKIVTVSYNAKSSIAVYPNPSNGLYTIVLNEKEEIEQISLMTTTGQSIDVNMTDNQLDLTNEAAGVYFLQVNGENIRLIKN